MEADSVTDDDDSEEDARSVDALDVVGLAVREAPASLDDDDDDHDEDDADPRSETVVDSNAVDVDSGVKVEFENPVVVEQPEIVDNIFKADCVVELEMESADENNRDVEIGSFCEDVEEELRDQLIDREDWRAVDELEILIDVDEILELDGTESLRVDEACLDDEEDLVEDF